MNRVEVRGGLTRDAEFRFVGQANTPLLEFSVAVNGTRYDAQTRQQAVKTTFVSVQVWGLQAEEIMSKYALGQGDEVYVLGELDQREIEKKDGTKERKTRVTGFHIVVLRSRHYQAPNAGSSDAPPGGHATEPPY